MNQRNRTVLLISGDPVVTEQCVIDLGLLGDHYDVVTETLASDAIRNLQATQPAAVFIDESAILDPEQGESLQRIVAALSKTAPVVVAATAEKQDGLRLLITSMAVDFVPRTGRFVRAAMDRLDRHARFNRKSQLVLELTGHAENHFEDYLQADFGEILRHEVNNPLTGILGNTELLLARREGLPAGAVERLQTIAELAVRLRETVRRLSNAWDGDHEHVGPA